MNNTTLIDTNILVYAHDTADLRRQDQAMAVLAALQPRPGILAAQVLAEFVNAAIYPKHGLPPLLTIEAAASSVERLATTFTVLDLSPAVVAEAIRGVRVHRLSHYDAQIWAVAKLNQVPVVFSEDFQDGMVLEGVRFVNPFATGFDISRWVTG